MAHDVPQWVRIACQRWGRQKRRIWRGCGEWYLDHLGKRAAHVDGYIQSFLGRVQDEAVGAGAASELRQKWPEVFWGDGLDVQRALFGMPEECHATLHMCFVFDPEFGLTVRRKAALLEMPLRSYSEAIIRGEMWIWARLEPKTACVPWPEVLHVIEAQGNECLPFPQSAPTFRANQPKLAELSLKALGRPLLRRR